MPSCQSLTYVQDFFVLVRFRDEDAPGNATSRIDRFSRCINHRHVGPSHSKTFSNVPAAGRATKVDVGEQHVNRGVRIAQRDSLFAASGLDNKVARFMQTAGNIVSDEKFVLDHENNQYMSTIRH